jgi:hypothetical protein
MAIFLQNIFIEGKRCKQNIDGVNHEKLAFELPAEYSLDAIRTK